MLVTLALVLVAVGCSSSDDGAETAAPGAAGGELVAAFSYETTYDQERAGPTSCPIERVRFTDESRGGPTGWEWDFPGAPSSTEQDPVVEGQPTGGEVTLTVTRGEESDSVTQQVDHPVC